MPVEETWITIAEAAKLLGKRQDAVAKMARTGELGRSGSLVNENDVMSHRRRMMSAPAVEVGDVVAIDRNLSTRGKHEHKVRGYVEQLYPKFAVVRMPGGYQETWDYGRIRILSREEKRNVG